MGCSPRLIPLLIHLPHNATTEDISAHAIINKLREDVSEAQDNLLHAKIMQAFESNKNRSLNFPFTIGSCVCLTMLHRCNDTNLKVRSALRNSCHITMVPTPLLTQTNGIPQ